MIQVLYTSFQSRLRYEVYSFYLRSLPDHLRSKMFRYKRWQDAQAFFLGKVLLIECLSRFGLGTECLKNLEYGKNDRPFLPGGIDFNISHSGSYVICCASDRYRVGIDIEEMEPICIQDFKEQFTNLEMQGILESPTPHQTFFDLWTKKEAIVKADGRGLAFPLDNIVFENEDHAQVEGVDWYLKRIEIDNGLSACLATNRKIEDNIIVKEFHCKCISESLQHELQR